MATRKTHQAAADAAPLSSGLSRHLPRYKGRSRLPSGLPTQGEAWTLEERDAATFRQPWATGLVEGDWQWPAQLVYFISDPHADAEAFVDSLVASGGVKKTGHGPLDFRLTKAGRKGRFIIGGDCLDKGPSNLDMLRSLKHLMDSGAEVVLLAGNHDMRLLMGLVALELQRSARTEHLFVRMGSKVVPLLKEVYTQYLATQDEPLVDIPSRKACRGLLFPDDQWFETFPALAAEWLSEGAIKKELNRLRKKVAGFEEACEKADLSLRQVYAAAIKLGELFLHPKGEFAWFYQIMGLAHREGAFLFVHAGLDDHIAEVLEHEDIDALNQRFARTVVEDPFQFYYGPLANTLRTKYRKVDFPLTEAGVARLHRQGIHAVVHGHINLLAGQSLKMRRGMLHIDGDITLDRHSRRKEGLKGHGAGVTLIHPAGQVIGISNDYPRARVFEPHACLAEKPRSPQKEASS